MPGVPWFSALTGLYPGMSPFVPGMPLHHPAAYFGAPGGLMPAASVPHAASLPAPPAGSQPGMYAALPSASAPPGGLAQTPLDVRERRSDTSDAAPSLRRDGSVAQHGSQSHTAGKDSKPAGASAQVQDRTPTRGMPARSGSHARQQASADGAAAGAQPPPHHRSRLSAAELPPPTSQPCVFSSTSHMPTHRIYTPEPLSLWSAAVHPVPSRCPCHTLQACGGRIAASQAFLDPQAPGDVGFFVRQPLQQGARQHEDRYHPVSCAAPLATKRMASACLYAAPHVAPALSGEVIAAS